MKEWSWSFSKKKTYDNCPKKYYEVDVQHNFVEDDAQLRAGNEVHKALAAALLHAAGIPYSGSGRDKITAAPLPQPYAYLQPWIDVVSRSTGTLKVEEKYAITRDFQKTAYFADNVWYRGICDVLRITGNTATALDWKTGKINHDSIQLMLMATCIFIYFPQVDVVKTRFVWLKENCTTRDEWHRASIMKEWPNVIAEVNAMEEAHKTFNFPPRPSGLCRKHCSVNTCAFWGKGGRS